MRKKIQDYLNFSSIERTGIIALMVIIFILIAGNLWLNKAHFPEREYDYSGYKLQVDSFRKSLSDTSGLQAQRKSVCKAENTLFCFNPNTASIHELEKLGINKIIARRIVAYRNKGGRFLKKEDLLKIYDFDSALYALLYPYISIPKDSAAVISGEKHIKTSPYFIIELNNADTTELKKLPGVGSVLALRIIKYRNLLGGFYSVQQLKEVYGISDSLFIKIKPYLKTDTALINRIQVNEADKYKLSRHPYVGEFTAGAILAYRKSCGKIKTFEELITNKIIAPSEKDKIKPYFLFN